MKKVGLVIVLYNPEVQQLQRSLEVILPQVDLCCIVDNTSKDTQLLPDGDEVSSWITDFMTSMSTANVHYIALHHNEGIAKAQNVGIEYLVGENCHYIVFSDQDSITLSDTVERLLTTHIALSEKGYPVGVVGSSAINRTTGFFYPVKAKKYGVVRAEGLCLAKDVVEYDSVRSSVSVITAEHLKLVGGFEEELFIDGVDNEWCWRARSRHGLKSYLAQDAIVYHKLGDADTTLAGKKISVTPYYRLYYQYRNFIWLFGRGYVPVAWKVKNFIKYMVKMVYYPIKMPQHKLYAESILHGLRDGFFTPQRNTPPKTYL